MIQRVDVEFFLEGREMFEKALRDVALAGTIALSACGFGKACAQEKAEFDAAPQAPAARVVGEKEVGPLAEASMPALSGAARLEQVKIPSSLRYLTENVRGIGSDALFVLLTGGACALAGGALGLEGANIFRPSPKNSAGEYDHERQESFDKIVRSVGVGTALTAALLGGGLVAHSLSQVTEFSINTTVSAVADAKMLIGTDLSIRIPEITSELEIPNRELFNMLRPGDPIKVNFVVEADGSTVAGWYLSPLGSSR